MSARSSSLLFTFALFTIDLTFSSNFSIAYHVFFKIILKCIFLLVFFLPFIPVRNSKREETYFYLFFTILKNTQNSIGYFVASISFKYSSWSYWFLMHSLNLNLPTSYFLPGHWQMFAWWSWRIPPTDGFAFHYYGSDLPSQLILLSLYF